MVYIREAHAADGSSPLPIKGEADILTPKTAEDRCGIASRFLAKKRFKYLVVTDDLKDSVDKAYDAFPDRLYVVDADGKVAIQGAPGPFGFEDSIKRVKKWLFDYRRSLGDSAKKSKIRGS